MLRSAKRRPESTVSDLTDRDESWLDYQMAGDSTDRFQSSERGRDAADLAEKVLNELSPEDRLVVMSIDGEQVPVKDVAEMTGWSESKVKVRAFRARRRLREAVEKLLEHRRSQVHEKG